MENNRLTPHEESMEILKQQYKDCVTYMSANDIYTELAESRACYERGEYEDFDDALNEISEKYGL